MFEVIFKLFSKGFKVLLKLAKPFIKMEVYSAILSSLFQDEEETTAAPEASEEANV